MLLKYNNKKQIPGQSVTAFFFLLIKYSLRLEKFYQESLMDAIENLPIKGL